jgi:hypothetical protein
LPTFAERLAPFERARSPPLTGLRRRLKRPGLPPLPPSYGSHRAERTSAKVTVTVTVTVPGRLLREDGTAARNVRRSGDSG